jgi:hypothetical protein
MAFFASWLDSKSTAVNEVEKKDEFDLYGIPALHDTNESTQNRELPTFKTVMVMLVRLAQQ